MLRRLLKWAIRIVVVLVVLGAGGYGIYRWLVPQAAAGALREEVLKLGGTLVLKSKVGEGTAIEIRLPEFQLEEPAVLRSA